MSRSAPRNRPRLPRLLSALAALAAALATSFAAVAGLTAQETAAFRVDSASVAVSAPLAVRSPSVRAVLTDLDGPPTWSPAGRPDPAPTGQEAPEPETFRPPMGSAILGGTLGSAAGLVGGMLVGYSMRSCSPGEWFCGMGEAAVGGLIGSVVGSTVGANLGARRGGATPTFGSTVLSGMAGVLTGWLGSMAGARVDRESGFGVLLGWSLGQGLVTGITAARRH